MGNKNISTLLAMVDWDLQARKPYVVCDPFDPSSLLYMTDKEYQVLLRTAMSNNEVLVVVARPGSQRPESSSPASDTSLRS